MSAGNGGTEKITLVGIEAENYRRLTAARIELVPSKGLVRVTGANAAGKTSLLKAVAGARGSGWSAQASKDRSNGLPAHRERKSTALLRPKPGWAVSGGIATPAGRLCRHQDPRRPTAEAEDVEEVVVGLGVGSDAQPEPEHGALAAFAYRLRKGISRNG